MSTKLLHFYSVRDPQASLTLPSVSLELDIKVLISFSASRGGDAAMAAKLKSYENKVTQLEAENHKLQSSVQIKVRQLQKDLEQKTNLITKYEQQIADLRGSKLKGSCPVMSQNGSVGKLNF